MRNQLIGLGCAVVVLGCQVPEGPDQTTTSGDNIISVRSPTDGGDGGFGASPATGTGGAGVGGAAGAPMAPATWQEHWFEHNQLLKKVADSDDDVVYFDNDVDPASAGWIQPLVAALWKYTKATYSVPGDPRLFAVFHAGRYSGEHAASIFDPTHDFRNVIDLGGAASLWAMPANLPNIAYSAGQVLEKSAFGVDTLPSVALTGYQFGYFFAYDALKAVGMGAAADTWLSALMSYSSDSPRAGTFWSRDWYYPLWQAYGGAAVFARFMQLCADKYPKVPRADGHGQAFAPAMNWGEYIHFMSGAAGTDLKTLATKAFGWPDARETEYQQAKTDFPTIKYDPPTPK